MLKAVHIRIEDDALGNSDGQFPSWNDDRHFRLALVLLKGTIGFNSLIPIPDGYFLSCIPTCCDISRPVFVPKTDRYFLSL